MFYHSISATTIEDLNKDVNAWLLDNGISEIVHMNLSTVANFRVAEKDAKGKVVKPETFLLYVQTFAYML